MKKINIILAALLALVGISFTSCEDDVQTQAKAVLCSVFQLNFTSNPADGQEIKVVSDAEWHIDQCPEWVTVTPDHGSGTTFVTVTAAPNYEGTTELNPRRGQLVFKGATKLSEAAVVIMQAGDAFYNVVPISISEIEAKDDDQYVISHGLTVVAPTTAGYVATDGSDFLYVKTNQSVEVGDVVSVLGQKQSDSNGFAYVDAIEVNPSTEAAATTPSATDITANLDSFKANKYQMVTVTGIMSGNNIAVTDMKYVVVAADASKEVKISDFDGHIVKATGVYAGTAAPAVNVIITGIEDLGVFETVYFKEDFEWMAPWAAVGNGSACGSTVEENNADANAPQLGTPKVDVDGVEVSAYQALLAKGYDIIACCHSSKSARQPQAQTYLQTNYLKFGLTGYYSGIVFPKFEVPEGAKPVLSFKWCPMVTGAGNIDKTKLVVIVDNDGEQSTYDIANPGWEKGTALEWIPVEIDLTGVLKSNSVITIRNSDDQWPCTDSASAMRWFLDDIKVKEK